MPRAKLFPIRITLPLTREMLAEVDAALADNEDRVSLIRRAIDAELKRRARKR
jgi:metal-responsive CopG/Arc/MetJ family transcriptional regulator